jgi:hypothetical protein
MLHRVLSFAQWRDNRSKRGRPGGVDSDTAPVRPTVCSAKPHAAAKSAAVRVEVSPNRRLTGSGGSNVALMPFLLPCLCDGAELFPRGAVPHGRVRTGGPQRLNAENKFAAGWTQLPSHVGEPPA